MSMKNLLPRPAMIVAVVALIAAVSGTAYAVKKIDTKDIANNAITARQVDNNSLKGKDFKKGGLTGSDIRNNKITGKQVNEDRLANVRSRWFVLNERGAIEAQSGGFTVLDAYDTNTNAYIDAGESLVDNGLVATIAIQNQINVGGPSPTGPNGSNSSGEVSVSRCQIPGVVECAPANSKNLNALVVSPRQSSGAPAATASPASGPGTSTKRVYVVVTESAPGATTSPYTP